MPAGAERMPACVKRRALTCRLPLLVHAPQASCPESSATLEHSCNATSCPVLPQQEYVFAAKPSDGDWTIAVSAPSVFVSQRLCVSAALLVVPPSETRALTAPRSATVPTACRCWAPPARRTSCSCRSTRSRSTSARAWAPRPAPLAPPLRAAPAPPCPSLPPAAREPGPSCPWRRWRSAA